MTDRMLFVMDPLSTVNIDKDTTFAFMLEAQVRGYEVWVAMVEGLGIDAAGGFARCTPVTAQRVAAQPFEVGETVSRPLSDFRAVWMRKDPPVDMAYVYATHVLDAVDPEKTLVLNRPSGLRAANEKSVIMRFPDCIPASIITSDRARIRAFVRENGGKCVVKPLDRMGGAGIFVLSEGDPNLASILESATNYGKELVMVQAFVPDAAKGDKRILLIGGEPIGAILRVPQGDDFRGNMAVGGTAVAAEITEEEQRIIRTVVPTLEELGLYFVGLDIIGERMTELNVTSPTGVQEVKKLGGIDAAAKVFDWVATQL